MFEAVKGRGKNMNQRIGLARILEAAALAMLISACVSVLAQQQPPKVTRPSASSVQATPRREPLPYGSAANAATGLKLPQGSITGIVYWQMNVLQPQSDCQGLTVKVITVNKTGMPLQLLSSTSTFTAMGPMTDQSAQGTPKYMLCSYSFHNMPENVALRALLYAPPSETVTTPPAFQIHGGSCNSTPSSSLSFILSGGEMLCGDGAFNVNFNMVSKNGRTVPPGVTAPLLSPKGTPSPSGGSLLLNSAPGTNTTPSGGTLLSSGGSGGATTSRGTLLAGGSGAGAYTGGVKSPLPGAKVGLSLDVPKMPPMQSNPKRDAAPPADAAAKAQIKEKLQTQLTTLKQRTARSPESAALKVADSKVSEIQALQAQKMYVESLRRQAGQPRDRLLEGPTQNITPHDPAATNPILHEPAKVCLNPQIHAVNGKTAGIVFSQDPTYNDYKISGCRFGTQTGEVYLSGAITGGRINLVVKHWSDTEIEAVFQPGLSGVLDGWPDLIVAPPNVGTPAKFPNCRFYAQRQSVILPSIPQQYVTLANVQVGDGTHGGGTMYCPGPDLSHLFPCIAFNAGLPLDGITNGHDNRNQPSQTPSNAVDRDGGQVEFESGEDVYDLSYMAPGFEVDSEPRVFWYAWTSDVCEGWASDANPKKPGDSVGYYVEGSYTYYNKTKTKVVVDWGVDHCAWRWLGVFRVNDWYNSGYSLQVYVNGPIGVDPWTGHPTSSPTRIGEKVPSRLVRMQ